MVFYSELTRYFIFFVLFLAVISSPKQGLVSSFQISSYGIEEAIWQKLEAEGSLADIQIDGFYHVSNWKKYWKETIFEQMKILNGNRLQSGMYLLSSTSNSIDSQPYNTNRASDRDVNRNPEFEADLKNLIQ